MYHFILSSKLGILFASAFLFFSCDKKMEAPNHAEPKIAKTVPPDYFKASDSGFINQQDTVYFKGIFFTGYRYSLYENGDTAVLQSYFNGVEEGSQKKWFPNKQLAEERFFINGKKEGNHKGWWPNGGPKFIYELYGDLNNGVCKEWNASGLLWKDFHYVKGQEEGSERLWWDNGTVRANYVIRNGKKYGLLGLTVCKNPYDSIINK